jgi:hypothetical protein
MAALTASKAANGREVSFWGADAGGRVHLGAAVLDGL